MRTPKENWRREDRAAVLNLFNTSEEENVFIFEFTQLPKILGALRARQFSKNLT